MAKTTGKHISQGGESTQNSSPILGAFSLCVKQVPPCYKGAFQLCTEKVAPLGHILGIVGSL